MYKEASRLKLKVATNRGALGVEQLWDLPVEELDVLAVSLEESYIKSGKKSYLVIKTKKDKQIKLLRDIIVDILTTKVDESAELRDISLIKQHNEKINGLIADKEDEDLKSMSVEELTKRLK